MEVYEAVQFKKLRRKGLSGKEIDTLLVATIAPNINVSGPLIHCRLADVDEFFHMVPDAQATVGMLSPRGLNYSAVYMDTSICTLPRHYLITPTDAKTLKRIEARRLKDNLDFRVIPDREIRQYLAEGDPDLLLQQWRQTLIDRDSYINLRDPNAPSDA